MTSVDAGGDSDLDAAAITIDRRSPAFGGAVGTCGFGSMTKMLPSEALLDAPPRPRHISPAMATRLVIDHRTAPPRHPEKAHRPDNPIQRKPAWIRVKAPTHPVYHETRALMRDNGLVTVCEEAACPNIGECWSQRHATMMIMGDTCTRACAFCNVAHRPARPARRRRTRTGSPMRWRSWACAHVVITSVDRDDLPDGGAAHFAATIRAIRAAAPATTIEVLTPDFLRKPGAVEMRGRRAPRRLQPQPGDGAAALSHHPPRRALLRLAAPAAPGEAARSRRSSPSPA